MSESPSSKTPPVDLPPAADEKAAEILGAAAPGTDGAKPKKGRFWRFVFWTLALFMFLFLAVSVVVIIFVRQMFFTPIKIENADTLHLIGWAWARDLTKESHETQQELSEAYFSEITTDAAKIDFEDENVKKVLPQVKKTILQREEMLDHWESIHKSDGSIKRLYKIAKTDAPAILSADISPSDRLNAQLAALKESGKTMVPAAQTKIERNIRALTKAWFLSKIAAYDAADDQDKPKVLLDTADNLQHLQGLYNQLRQEAGLKTVEDLAQLRELNFAVASWYDDTPAEELARLLWFKDLLLSIMVARQAGLSPKIDSMIFRSSEQKKKPKGLLRGIL